MNRREFLTQASLTAGAILLSPVITSCGIQAASPVVVQVGGQVIKTIGVWFVQYMVKLGAEELYDTVTEFVAGQTSEEANRIEETNEHMKESGFTDFDGKKVYKRNGIYTYEVGHRDEFNGCGAFFDGNKNNIALVEGPTVIGLAKAAEDYRADGRSANETANALLPIAQHQAPSSNAFSNSYDQKYVALTDFGTVIVDYQKFDSSSAVVSVTVADRQAQQVFKGDYNVSFN